MILALTSKLNVMTHQYVIKGISCEGCIENIKKSLEPFPDISDIQVQKPSPQLTLTMHHHIPTEQLKEAVKKFGNYELSELN